MLNALRGLGVIIVLLGGNLVLAGIVTTNPTPIVIGVAGMLGGGTAMVANGLPEQDRGKILWIAGTGISLSATLMGVLALSPGLTLLGLSLLGPSLVGLFLMPAQDSTKFPLPSWSVHLAGAGLVMSYVVSLRSPSAGLVVLALVAILQTAFFLAIALRARAA
jgi:hypothetical protein